MSEWITDRLPTEADSDIMGKVWVWEDNAVYWSDYSVVTFGTPWMPIKSPAPYVKPEPQRWKPRHSEEYYSVVRRVDHLTNFIQAYWRDDIMHEARFKDGNVFQTKEQALEASRRLRETFLNYHKELLQ
jgi:hypothetical protein